MNSFILIITTLFLANFAHSNDLRVLQEASSDIDVILEKYITCRAQVKKLNNNNKNIEVSTDLLIDEEKQNNIDYDKELEKNNLLTKKLDRLSTGSQVTMVWSCKSVCHEDPNVTHTGYKLPQGQGIALSYEAASLKSKDSLESQITSRISDICLGASDVVDCKQKFID